VVAAVAVADTLRFPLRVIPVNPVFARNSRPLRNLHLRRLDSPGFDAVLPLMVDHDHAY
jgi:hypothetical protein